VRLDVGLTGTDGTASCKLKTIWSLIEIQCKMKAENSLQPTWKFGIKNLIDSTLLWKTSVTFKQAWKQKEQKNFFD